MKTDGLFLEHLPPLMTPYRFFVSAPLLGVLAALVLLTGGADSWSSRWSPEVLAATHLLTLGFMAMVMVGALFQVLPVLSGHSIDGGQRWLAPTLHLLLSSGTLALAGGFLFHYDSWRLTALLLLGATFSLFIGALGLRLVKPIGGGDSIFAIRLAALSLLATIVLGMLMLWGYLGGQYPLALHQAGISHLRIALFGWVLLLVMGVSYQVIPMFHVTPNFPKIAARLLPGLVFLALLVMSVTSTPWLLDSATTVLILAAMSYGVITLDLFRRRKRKIVDYTIRFWQLGLSTLLVALLCYGLALVQPDWVQSRDELRWGVLMVPGFAISIIIGMLHKIAPFLSWLHLQRACLHQPMAMIKLPTMHELLPVRRARIQFWLHCVTLGLLLLATVYSPLGAIASIALAADFGWLGLSLVQVLRAYRQALAALDR
jgi:hypothetical protein